MNEQFHLPSASSPPSEGYWRLAAVLAHTALSKSTVYALVQEGRFPAPVKLTAHASGWRVGDVRAWLANPTGWRAADAA